MLLELGPYRKPTEASEAGERHECARVVVIGNAQGNRQMTEPSVLLVPRELDFVASDLEDVYNLLRLWDDPPADELANARVLVCLGPQSTEALTARMPARQSVV